MPSLKVALAEDEPLAQERLARLLEECGCLVEGRFGTAEALLAWLREGHRVDGLFLDIQMPGLSGLELAAELKDGPPVVFVTAHAGHALQAFDVAAVDFLMKPVFKERLLRSLERLRGQRPAAAAAKEIQTRIPVKAGEGHVFVDFKKITHFEVESAVVWVWCQGQRYRSAWRTLSEVEEAFPEAGLLRIQRHLLLRPPSVLGMKSLWGGRAVVRIAEGMDLEISRNAAPKLRGILGLPSR